MRRKTTIHDIARELNTTAATVSRALHDHPSISAATKESVREAARRLNYRQNKLASSLRSGRSHLIGVIIPSAETSFFGSVVHGIERIARTQGYSVLLFQSNEDPAWEAEGIEALFQSNVDGIIASVTKETVRYGHYMEVKRRNIPLILFDRVDDSLQVPSVVIDDYKGAFRATEHLIRQGYVRIAHIAGQQHLKIFNARLRGYADALRAYGMDVQDDLITYGKVSIESGRDCAEQLLGQPNPPDAIVAVEDFTALGAMQAIKQRGLRMPDDIGIIGFANESFGAYLTPSLSTIDQQTARMGEEAARLFLQLETQRRLAGKVEASQNHAADRKQYAEPAGKDGEGAKVVLEPVLIVRGSSRRNKEDIE